MDKIIIFLTGFFPKYRCLSWRNFALLFRFFWVTYFLDDLLHLYNWFRERSMSILAWVVTSFPFLNPFMGDAFPVFSARCAIWRFHDGGWWLCRGLDCCFRCDAPFSTSMVLTNTCIVSVLVWTKFPWQDDPSKIMKYRREFVIKRWMVVGVLQPSCLDATWTPKPASFSHVPRFHVHEDRPCTKQFGSNSTAAYFATSMSCVYTSPREQFPATFFGLYFCTLSYSSHFCSVGPFPTKASGALAWTCDMWRKLYGWVRVTIEHWHQKCQDIQKDLIENGGLTVKTEKCNQNQALY